jgi:hypothetical protein
MKTGKDLASDPLLRRLETCHSPDDILLTLREQISAFGQSRGINDGLTRWLNPTVNALCSLSAILNAGAGIVSLGNVASSP